MLNRHRDVFITDEMRLFLWAHQTLNVTAHDKRFLNSGRGEFTSYLGAAFPDLIRGFYASVRAGRAAGGTSTRTTRRRSTAAVST
jgi:hypothetical protein